MPPEQRFSAAAPQHLEMRGYYVDEEITAAQRAPELPALADMLVERLALELDEAVD